MLWHISCACVVFGTSLFGADVRQDTHRIAAIRQMREILKKEDYRAFYQEHCHPHLHKQIEINAFERLMSTPRGEAMGIKLFNEVLDAVDGKADDKVLIARPQAEKDEYEFILVKVRDQLPAERKGRQWHLELKLDEGKWKLMDTD